MTFHQKHQKGWSRALAIVESGTGQTTKHESAAQMWQSLTGRRKANQHLLSWRISHSRGVGSSNRKQSHTPPSILYVSAHPQNTWLPPAFKLSPLAPNMRSRAPGSMEVSHAMASAQLKDRQLLAVSNCTGLLPALPTASRLPRQGAGSELHGDINTKSRVSTLLLEISRLSK